MNHFHYSDTRSNAKQEWETQGPVNSRSESNSASGTSMDWLHQWHALSLSNSMSASETRPVIMWVFRRDNYSTIPVVVF